MQGIVHCGICPTSVFMRGDKSVCLGDLFHAFDTRDENNHRSGHKVGNLDYMPPEAIWSDSTPAEDADSIGLAQFRPSVITALWMCGRLECLVLSMNWKRCARVCLVLNESRDSSQDLDETFQRCVSRQAPVLHAGWMLGI